MGKGGQIYVTDGTYQSKKFGRYFSGDLILEKRIISGLYGLTGLSFFQTGHSNYLDDGSQGSRTTDMTTSYLGIPLMVRVNYLNFLFIDIGMIGRIPVYANLEEYGRKGTASELHDRQNIAKYLNQFSLGFSTQASLVYNRFMFTWYWTFGKTKIDPALEDVWAVGAWSLFLRDLQPKFTYQMMGLKLGVRIK
jgi:hypothetical protein